MMNYIPVKVVVFCLCYCVASMWQQQQQPNGENVIRRDKPNKEKTLRIMREF